MTIPTFTLRQMVEAGVHFGHHARRWNPQMAPFIYGKKDNVHITHNMNLIAYLGQNELAGLRFENTIDRTIHEYPTNNVFVAIGQVSQNDLFKSLVQTDEHGFIITDEKMETSLPGIFAVGDTRKKDVRQVASAIGDASIASVFIDKYLQLNSHVK